MLNSFLFPLTGTLLNLENCPEKIFADKTLGDGFVIKFTGNILISPIKGVVIATFPTGHAFIIRDDKTGFEVLMHAGLKSAHKEDAFQALVKKYQRVEAGQALTLIKTEYFDDTNNYCPVLFADPQQKFSLKKLGENIEAGDSNAVIIVGA